MKGIKRSFHAIQFPPSPSHGGIHFFTTDICAISIVISKININLYQIKKRHKRRVSVRKNLLCYTSPSKKYFSVFYIIRVSLFCRCLDCHSQVCGSWITRSERENAIKSTLNEMKIKKIFVLSLCWEILKVNIVVERIECMR